MHVQCQTDGSKLEILQRVNSIWRNENKNLQYNRSRMELCCSTGAWQCPPHTIIKLSVPLAQYLAQKYQERCIWTEAEQSIAQLSGHWPEKDTDCWHTQVAARASSRLGSMFGLLQVIYWCNTEYRVSSGPVPLVYNSLYTQLPLCSVWTSEWLH